MTRHRTAEQLKVLLALGVLALLLGWLCTAATSPIASGTTLSGPTR